MAEPQMLVSMEYPSSGVALLKHDSIFCRGCGLNIRTERLGRLLMYMTESLRTWEMSRTLSVL